MAKSLGFNFFGGYFGAFFLFLILILLFAGVGY